MDFKLAFDNGMPRLTFVKNDNIGTTIWMLLHIEKGSFFFNPDLGSELWRIKKLTDQNANQAQQYIERALTPLVRSGRATSIKVVAERDTQDRTRLNYSVQATQPDGLIVNYADFYRVV